MSAECAPGATFTRDMARGGVSRRALRYKMTAARKRLNSKGIPAFLFRPRYKMSYPRNRLF